MHFTHLDGAEEGESAQDNLKSVSLTLSISIDDRLTWISSSDAGGDRWRSSRCLAVLAIGDNRVGSDSVVLTVRDNGAVSDPAVLTIRINRAGSDSAVLSGGDNRAGSYSAMLIVGNDGAARDFADTSYTTLRLRFDGLYNKHFRRRQGVVWISSDSAGTGDTALRLPSAELHNQHSGVVWIQVRDQFTPVGWNNTSKLGVRVQCEGGADTFVPST